MVHKTDAMNQVKALRLKAKAAKSKLSHAQALLELPENRELAKTLRDEHEEALAAASALKASQLHRLEDLEPYEVKKTNKKGKTYSYWHCSWMEGDKVINVYLGAFSKMTEAEALLKAKRLKAAALGINQSLPEESEQD